LKLNQQKTIISPKEQAIAYLLLRC